MSQTVKSSGRSFKTTATQRDALRRFFAWQVMTLIERL